MKNPKTIFTLIIGTITAQLCGYEFSFHNATSTPIAIAIQFANSENEPLYKLYVKPGTMKSFVPGSVDIPDIKWSFCLRNIYYIKNPTMQERAHNFAKITHWKKTSITWVDKPLQTTPDFAKTSKNTSKSARHSFSDGGQKPRTPQQRKKLVITEQPVQRVLVKKQTPPAASKSLCKDRHFEITEDEHGNIVITGSTVE